MQGQYSGKGRVASTGGTLKVTFESGTLTAEVSGAPLAQVLNEVARLTGAEVRGLGEAGRETVSASFAGLAFQEAIGRLVRTKSFVLVTAGTDAHTRLVRIVILNDVASRCLQSPAPPDGRS